MNILFIHQNFPGQYLRIAEHMRNKGHTVFAIGESANIKRHAIMGGITTLSYETPKSCGADTHHYLRDTEADVRRGQAVARILLHLRDKGTTFDLIYAHPGWGEALFLRDIFPKTPLVLYCNFFFRNGEGDLGFDPEFPSGIDSIYSTRFRNTSQVLSLLTADACITASRWQASCYPPSLCKNLLISHEGIDTPFMSPDPAAELVIQPLETPGESRVQGSVSVTERPSGPPLRLTKKDKVITFAVRNIEPYRGAHIFLRTLPALQKKHPDAHVLIVGGDNASYSPKLPKGQTYKAKFLAELQGKLDLSHIHFLGRLPYLPLRALFRISSAHVFLTYPYALSWSMQEAMSCGCLLIASRTPPVEEVVTDGKNGLLVDFFDQKALLERMDEALRSPDKFVKIRNNARETIQKHFELQTCLKEQEDFLLKVVADKLK